MTAKKTTKKKATTKTTTAKVKVKAKSAASTAQATAEEASETVENRFGSIISQIRGNLAEAREALAESGAVMDEHRRDIAMTMISNMQENADETFASLEDVVNADSVGETLKISRDALRSGIERNVRQVKEFAQATADSSKESAEPMAEYISTLRTKVLPGADA